MSKLILEELRKSLGHKASVSKRQRKYLDTGSPYLNAVIGNKDRGLEYGKMLEIAGWSSNGKSALTTDLAATSQADGSLVVWLDLENSFDEEWSERRGLNVTAGDAPLILIRPYIGVFPGDKRPRLSSAEILLEEAETIITKMAKKYSSQLLVVDSIAALMTQSEADSDIGHRSMKTKMGFPDLLGQLMRRWIGFLYQHNCTAILINQLRHKPLAFGNPEYTMGGNAIPFYCHSRIRIRRGQKGGRVTGKFGKQTGIKGIIKNEKNKAGGIEHDMCGFRIMFNGQSQFFDAKELDSE